MELKRPDEGEKGFEKVFAFLRDRLLAGSLKPGDRLISERDHSGGTSVQSAWAGIRAFSFVR